jgi:hypothetical protein
MPFTFAGCSRPIPDQICRAACGHKWAPQWDMHRVLIKADPSLQVAGKFAFGVMAASAATFLFWSTAGVHLFPQVSNNIQIRCTGMTLFTVCSVSSLR